MITKIERRQKIKLRIRGKISGTAECPRMTVFRSNKQIYVQLVDDLAGKTLVAASSRGLSGAPKKEIAAQVGQAIAKKAQEAGITEELKNWQMLPVTVDLNFNRDGRN